MEVIILKNYQEVCEKAFEIFKEEIQSKNTVLGLATGSTPVGLYKLLVEDFKKNHTTYKNVTTFNLDEYVGLPQTHAQSYYTFMFEHLFSHVDINESNIHIPNGSVEDVELEAKNYEETLSNNTIDIQLLGIGRNGHIGFNEPGASFNSVTSVVGLTQSTIDANARFFEGNPEQVPTKAISMGIGSILRSKKIVLMATGSSKSEAIYKTVKGPVTEDVPASVLQNHPNVVVIVDEAAGSLL